MKNITIECSEKEALLIEKALDLYSRISLGQFGEIGQVVSIKRKLWKDDVLSDKFNRKCDELKNVFGLSLGSYWGVFNKENVDDDAREAFHIEQVMRHERYLHRMRTGEQKESHGTKDEYMADACDIAGITAPNFKMSIEE
jgi:hypothetical protein